MAKKVLAIPSSVISRIFQLKRKGYKIKLAIKEAASEFGRTQKSVKLEWRAFPFRSPVDKIASMLHEGYTISEAYFWAKQAFGISTTDEVRHLWELFQKTGERFY